ncbi:MAG: potassium-transporting ATPase subunit KdpA [Candidatus Wallbacteria bacterium]|nr:potassium-transporting ATPase subunit KdpA [Candidatus Wallbacteria bacterium]
MTFAGWFSILVCLLLILALTKPFGIYLYRVFETERPPLAPILGGLERWVYRLSGVDPSKEHHWTEYARALLAFSLFGVLITHFIQRVQHLLPLNPAGLGPVAPDLAFNTAVSFTTNTNWQSYAGESTMSTITQMAGLTWHNFLSAACGVAVALALARGFTRQRGQTVPATIGNFWVDVTRCLLHVLLPISFLFALALVQQGVPQTFAPNTAATTLEGAKQAIPLGPVASQESIKMLGTNGGGYYNANSAHPFENPTPFSNLLEMISIFAIAAALTYTYGLMARNSREGWAIFWAMACLCVAGVSVCYWAESKPNPALAGLPLTVEGNLEGKEVRFGFAATALFATLATDASCGAVNGMHDSFNPLGGLVPLLNIQLGEVVFGGVGSGLYGMLVFVVLSVFIAGLMVGRTPELLGKKIEAKEVKLAVLYCLVFCVAVLGMTAAAAAVLPHGTSTLNNAGPHGLSEILYAASSAAGNNGSAFAGLGANTLFWNVGLAVLMWLGRFWMMIPVLGIAGSMVGKKTRPPGPGTFPTDIPLFTALLIGVVAIVGALTFFPALCLGPLVEHFVALHGKVY